MKHLLVTNDFPPKMGGIQSYLWELWRRLPTEEVTVLTPGYPDAALWDAKQPFEIVRVPGPALVPTPGTVRRIDQVAARSSAELVVLDPALPVGLVGPRLQRPYGVVLHGAEVTVPGRVPGARRLLGRVLRHARCVIAAGGYPATEAVHAARRRLPVTIIPPGVDVERFRPIDRELARVTRNRLGLPIDSTLVVSVSRLVPRKGMDVLIQATAKLAQRDAGARLAVAIAGAGRDRDRLERLAQRHRTPVHFLGRVSDAELPSLYASSDVFAMLCRNRWRGLEQEGFGIVFLEAAAAGLPQVAGRSGGAAEAVDNGVTGFVVDDPTDVDAVEAALAPVVEDEQRRREMGAAARNRAVEHFTYDVLAARLATALEESLEAP